MNPDLRTAFAEELENEYQTLREQNRAKQIKTTPLDEVRKKKLNLF